MQTFNYNKPPVKLALYFTYKLNLPLGELDIVLRGAVGNAQVGEYPLGLNAGELNNLLNLVAYAANVFGSNAYSCHTGVNGYMYSYFFLYGAAF